jgi:molybdopterin synthase catalytic subunit
MVRCEVRISEAPLQLATLLEGLAECDPDSGAVASFLGQVRAGEGLTGLELEHYPGVTENMLTRLAQDAASRWPLSRTIVVHRVGLMSVGEPIVFVGTAAPHRRAALEAVEFMIDVLKTQAPFWKKEHTVEGERWIEPRPEDHDAASYWLGNKE